MKEKKTLIGIHVIFKSIISVYFDSFFVLYFFKVANYNVIPIVKYYLVLYLFEILIFLLVKIEYI